jgi:hypothetical protein
MMRTGALLQDMAFPYPYVVIFFNQSPSKHIVACRDDIFIVEVSTQSMQRFSGTPLGAFYWPHSLALSSDDFVLVAGIRWRSRGVCGYSTVSLERLWIHTTASGAGAVCLHGNHVLVTMCGSPTLVLDRNTGAQVAVLRKPAGWIFGLGVIEGL